MKAGIAAIDSPQPRWQCYLSIGAYRSVSLRCTLIRLPMLRACSLSPKATGTRQFA